MKIARYFNVNEYTSWLISRTTFHNAVIIAEISNSIDQSKIRDAILLASSQQENLKLTISPNYCGFLFCDKTISIDFIKSNDSWKDISKRELNTPFKKMESLARIKVIETKKSNYISICAHHIICDGVSIINFLLKIVSLYNSDIISAPSPNKDNICLLKYPIPIPTPLKKARSHCKKINANITKVQELLIKPSVTQQILNYTKANKISINSLISALLLLSFQQSLGIETSINLHIPISIRKKAINSENNLGFYTSWINMNFDPRSTGIDYLSMLINSDFKKSLLTNTHHKNLEDLNILICTRNSDADFMKKIQSTVPTICVSNCGVILTEKNKSDLSIMHISKLHLSVSCQAHMGEKSITSIVTNLNNQFIINLCYPYPLISDRNIESYIKNIKKNMSHFAINNFIKKHN